MNRYNGASQPDILLINDLPGNEAWQNSSGLTVRPVVIDPTKKTLILISAGQSQDANVQSNLYTPTNTANIDQLNPYDGLLYSTAGRLIGSSYSGYNGINLRLADFLISNGIFDRVILAGLNIGASSVWDWANGALASRIPAAVKRFAALGILPSTPGVTFALKWAQGEQDAAVLGTSQAAYVASFNAMMANARAAGFSGRTFVRLETYYIGGATSATIRAAQVQVVNGTTIFQGADTDAFDGSYRSDGLHFLTDVAAGAVASADFWAMHASGAPF